jgi:hypothetical protein
MHPMKYYSTLLKEQKNDSVKNVEVNNYSIKPRMPLSPKRRLLSILRNDKDIREWFSRWIGDLQKYQEETLDRTQYLHKEIEAMNIG